MKNDKLKTVLKVVLVLVALYFFLVSIGLMGKAFKGFGKEFSENLLSTTSNPFVGLFIGILATSLVQSSSTTTSIVVGMVASGIIGVGNAIPIVMGANIGTTVTNTLVSLGHVTRREEFKRAISGATVHDFFNLMCVGIMFPLELATGFLQKTCTKLSAMFVNVGGIKFTSPIKTATKPMIKLIKSFLFETLNIPHNVGYVVMLTISMLMLFFALYFIVRLMKSIVINKSEVVLNNVIGKNAVLGITAGLLFTIFVQSSSITTSLLVPLIGAGILTLETGFPITLGANIGTTATAILASFATGNPAAITIAFVHFLFNTIGVFFIYPISAFRKIPIKLAKNLGEIAYFKRRYALVYVLSVFFIIPGALIAVSKLIH